MLGPERTFILMAYLPPVGWADVATKQDLEHLHQVLALDIAVSEERLRAEMAELGGSLRVEMADLRADLTGEMSGLRADLTGSFNDFRNEIHADRRTAQRQLIFVLVVALVSMVVALSGLG